MMMKRITLTLIVGFCVALAASAFAFDWLMDQQGYADIPLPSSETDDVLHGKVKEYTARRIRPLDEHERWCRIGKRPIILSYHDNRVEEFRLGPTDFENPVLIGDSIKPTVFRLRCFNKTFDLNYTQKESIDAYIDFSQAPPRFSPFFRAYSRPYYYQEVQGEGTCAYYVELPDETVPKARDIRYWLLDFEDTIAYWDEVPLTFPPYSGDADDKPARARHFADRFFDYTDQFDADTQLEYDMRVYEYNPRYITYQQYTFCYLGGLHGFFTERLASFDLTTSEGITTDYLFKRDSQLKVKELLMETAFADKNFNSWNSIKTMEDVIRCFMPETMTIPNIIASFDSTYVQPNVRLERVDISRVGLAPEGVVFSYYPYELSCFAAGCFHFTIPYWKLRPFLTEKAKHCIGLN
jgi:hypothetical protein